MHRLLCAQRHGAAHCGNVTFWIAPHLPQGKMLIEYSWVQDEALSEVATSSVWPRTLETVSAPGQYCLAHPASTASSTVQRDLP